MRNNGRARGDQHSTRESASAVVGRESETAEIIRRIDVDRSHSDVLIITGEPGAGKSVLLDLAVGRARSSGRRVLRTVGSESETHLGFAGLYQMLRPVLGEMESLPSRQRSALRAVLGLDDGAETPDAMLVGLAVLTLLSEVAETRPLLVVVDDAQWIDRGTLDVLSFVARRMDSEPVTLLVGVRTTAALPGFDKGYERLEVGPLGIEAANRLLDQQPTPPTGRVRVRILEEAGGNPLALEELARVAAIRQLGGSSIEGPLPLTDRLKRIFAEHAADLPEPTRRTLLLLAAAGATDAPAASMGLPEADDKVLVPAEQAGLVRQEGPRVAFRNPLIRSAVYHAASFEERRQAHLDLAELLREEPDRRAWHLAAATLRPDQEVSAALQQTADRARRRGGYAAAAAALERAAELSPRGEDRARLLTEAAAAAVFTGQLGWVERLAAEVRESTDDPALTGAASLASGQLMAMGEHHTAAFTTLLRVAGEAAAARSPRVLDALAAAAVVRYYSGEEFQQREIQDLLSHVPDEDARAAMHAWVLAVSDPSGAGASLVPLLPGLIAEAKDDAKRLTMLAIVSWLLDQTPWPPGPSTRHSTGGRPMDRSRTDWGARPAGPIWSRLDGPRPDRWPPTSPPWHRRPDFTTPRRVPAHSTPRCSACSVTRPPHADSPGRRWPWSIRWRAAPSRSSHVGLWGWRPWPRATTTPRTRSSAPLSPTTAIRSTTTSPTPSWPNSPRRPSAEGGGGRRGVAGAVRATPGYGHVGAGGRADRPGPRPVGGSRARRAVLPGGARGRHG